MLPLVAWVLLRIARRPTYESAPTLTQARDYTGKAVDMAMAGGSYSDAGR